MGKQRKCFIYWRLHAHSYLAVGRAVVAGWPSELLFFCKGKGSTTLKSLGICGENNCSSICGFSTAFVKSLRIVDPSGKKSSVILREKSAVLKEILICGIIRRALRDRG